MAKTFKPLCVSLVLALVLISSANWALIVSEARPLKLASFSIEGSLFDIDGLSIEAMKTSGGPSSGGNGHGFTNSQILGGIKNGGPSPGGKGHGFTNAESLGGIKSGGGPSSGGKGHGFTNAQTLGGIKNGGGPSSGGKGHAFTNTHPTLGLGGRGN